MALQHIKKLPGNFLDKLFNDIYHKLAKMTLCSSLNVDKYHFKVIQGCYLLL